MKKLLFIAFIAITTASIAQLDLYSALEKNGVGCKYTEHSMYKAEGESLVIHPGGVEVTMEQINKIATGEYVGFRMIDDRGLARVGLNVLDYYDRTPYYPDVSFIYNSRSTDGYVVYKGNIFELADISEDGLSFGKFKKVFIPIKDKVEPVKEEGKEKKKLSVKERMKAMKDSYVAASSSGSPLSKEAKAILEGDIRAEINNYLKEMKAKYDAHSSSAEVVQAHKNIVKARENGEAQIKAGNDSIKATPEYQRAERQGNMITLVSRSSEKIYLWSKYPNKEVRSTYFNTLNYGEKTKVFCENKEIYYTTVPIWNGSKLAVKITTRDCKKTISIP